MREWRKSGLSKRIAELLEGLFPNYKIDEEVYVRFEGYQLYFDFVIPSLMLVIEVDGSQHDKFVEHFHGDADGYTKSKKRDSAKGAWAEANGYSLIRIPAAIIDNMDSGKLFELIQKGL